MRFRFIINALFRSKNLCGQFRVVIFLCNFNAVRLSTNSIRSAIVVFFHGGYVLAFVMVDNGIIRFNVQKKINKNKKRIVFFSFLGWCNAKKSKSALDTIATSDDVYIYRHIYIYIFGLHCMRQFKFSDQKLSFDSKMQFDANGI